MYPFFALWAPFFRQKWGKSGKNIFYHGKFILPFFDDLDLWCRSIRFFFRRNFSLSYFAHFYKILKIEKSDFFFLKPFLFKNMRFIKFSVFELMRSDWLIIEVLRPKLKFSTEVRVPTELLSLMSLAEGLVVPFFRSDLKSIWTWQWMSHFILSKVVPVQKKLQRRFFNLHVFTFRIQLSSWPVHDALSEVGSGNWGFGAISRDLKWGGTQRETEGFKDELVKRFISD